MSGDRYRLDDGWGEPPAGVPEESVSEALEAEQRAANHAQAFIDSDMYQVVMREMHDNLHAVIDALTLDEKDKLYEAKLQLHALKALDTLLRDKADTGKLAAAQSNQQVEEDDL